MNREDIMKLAREQGLPETATEGVFIVNSDDLGRMLADILSLAAGKGWSVKACRDPDYVAFDCGPAPDTNERMRLTSDGALLIVDDGRYWQVVSLKDAYEGLSKI